MMRSSVKWLSKKLRIARVLGGTVFDVAQISRQSSRFCSTSHELRKALQLARMSSCCQPGSSS